ncbi:MAG: VWA domain-containing protein [Actinomycetia bacterium]|nr:VWA domain-containing protein [Actinomycetes bacterium]
MSFDPILPAALIIAIGIALVAVRMLALYRVLVRTGPGRYRRVVLRWAGLTIAVLLIVLAAARPALGPPELSTETEASPSSAVPAGTNLNIFFVVDRSVASRVEDYDRGESSRMGGIRKDISLLIDRYPGGRFAMIGFSANATMEWPLSQDTWSLKPRVQGLSTYTEVEPDALFDVNTGAAHQLLQDKLAEALNDNPGSKNVVFYLSSGAGGSRVTQNDFNVKWLVDAGAVLGYGTTNPDPIPLSWVNEQLVFLNDPGTGQPLSAPIDEGRLRAIAGQLGVSYVHREQPDAVSEMTAQIEDISPESIPNAELISRTVERSELYWLFAALAAALVLAEIYWTLRDYRRSHLSRADVKLTEDVTS